MKVKILLFFCVLSLFVSLNTPVQAFGLDDFFGPFKSTLQSVLGETTKNAKALEQAALKETRQTERLEKKTDKLDLLKEKFASRSGAIKEKLASRSGALKEKACEARQTSALKRGDMLENLVTKMIENFDAIALRVQTYYLTKLVPSGKTIPNYDVLVANVATTKQDVLDSLDTAQATSLKVNCATVKEDTTALRSDSQKLKTALHQYRKAINNLIVAVRSSNGRKGNNTATGSGENTGTGSGTTGTQSGTVNP